MYLASLSASSRKRANRQLKAVHGQISTLRHEEEVNFSFHCEGQKNVPAAWNAFTEDLVYFGVQVAYLLADVPIARELPMFNAQGKRKVLDFQNFSWDAFPDLKLLILEGPSSFDAASRFLFAGAPAVIMLPEHESKDNFRHHLVQSMMEGKTVRESIQSASQVVKLQIPYIVIPSDPIEFWEWRENRLRHDLTQGCMLSFSYEERMQNWQWTTDTFIEPVVEEEKVEEEIVEEETPWYDEQLEFASWELKHEQQDFRQARQREYFHTAAMNGIKLDNPFHTIDPVVIEEPEPVEEYVVFPEDKGNEGQESTPTLLSDIPLFTDGADFHGHQEYTHHRAERGEHKADQEPGGASPGRNMSIPLMTWASLALCIFALGATAYIMPGRQTPSLKDLAMLRSFKSTENYNVLLLPFHPENLDSLEPSTSERELRDWVNSMRESEKMGVHVMYVNPGEYPSSSEEAKRIGSIYDANLVIWGNPHSRNSASGKHYLHYVATHALYGNEFSATNQSGANAPVDIYDLQEGYIVGSVEDIHHWILATAYLKKGEYQSAYSNLQLIQNKDKKGMALIHQMIAKCYYAMEYMEDCIASYTKAIDLDPGNPNPYFQRACMYELNEEPAKAIGDYNMALRMNPMHIKAKSRLKKLMDKEDDYDLTIPSVKAGNTGSFTLLDGDKTDLDRFYETR